MSNNRPPDHTTRATFDLDLDVHAELRRWAVERDVKLTDIYRALIGRLLTDKQVERKVERDLEGKQVLRHRPNQRPKGKG